MSPFWSGFEKTAVRAHKSRGVKMSTIIASGARRAVMGMLSKVLNTPKKSLPRTAKKARA